MIRQNGYEHTHTNPGKTKTSGRRQPKNADKTLFFAKEKPKPHTFVFDLGFTWRRKRGFALQRTESERAASVARVKIQEIKKSP